MVKVSGWKYKAGLCLIGAVVLIWVASAEVTQIIFSTYRHPFVLTWLGASLLSVYLPISWLKDFIKSWATSRSRAGKQFHPKVESQKAESHKSESPIPSVSPHLPLSVSPRSVSPAVDLELQRLGKGGFEVEERNNLLGGVGDSGEKRKLHHGDSSSGVAILTTKEFVKMAMILAPMWLLTEYLSNAALSLTSVASTTILSSTSGLFTLLFGVSLGHDVLTTPKVVSVLISISGVVMTELGKSTASDEVALGDKQPGETSGDNGLPGHNLIGDLLGLASAASYGLYTILLRKYAGDEEGKDGGPDMQKVFGFIGLVTLFGLWWIAFPLILLGWEPSLKMPRSYGLDEDIVGNALVGSVVSDYFWALTVVWTTPLVATLGLSLTIPLAMLADMVMHGRSYSIVYILGSVQVFGGFLIANLADRCTGQQKQGIEL